MTGFTKSKTEHQIQKLLTLARRNGGVDRRYALQMLHMTSKEFDSMIATAVDRGEIQIEKEKHGTRMATIYRVLMPDRGGF